MQKMKRKAVLASILESKLEKYNRRIQALAAAAYQVRQQLEAIQLLPVKQPLMKADIIDAVSKLEPIEDIELPIVFPNALGVTKEEVENAILNAATEGQSGIGYTDENAGGSDLQDPATPTSVLGQ